MGSSVTGASIGATDLVVALVVSLVIVEGVKLYEDENIRRGIEFNISTLTYIV